MKTRRRKKWLAAALSAQTLAATSAVPAIAQEGVPPEAVEFTQETHAQPVSVKPGSLKGTVVDPSTGKPWAKTQVELVDPKTKKVLAKTVTDAGGRYDLGTVEEGEYIIRTNQNVLLPVKVTGAATIHTLNLAIPSAVMGKIAGTLTWTTVSLIGAGVATAVAVPVGLSGTGGGGGGSVS